MTSPPEPLTQRQRTMFFGVALVCAASRFLAMARSPWDWDEALLVMGLRDYNVILHHPHPPGFPVYIALGKIVAFLVHDGFRALQTINMLAAMLLMPAMFFFARELRIGFRTSLAAGVLFAFFPNVWFFGGGAFSDVPSIALVLFAVTFLLRGAYDRNAYWLGTLLLALAMGIRPQNFLVGLLPGLYATRRRRPLEVLAALAIGVVVVALAFGGAIYATGPASEYFRIVREHGEYISRVDSWRSPERTPLWRLLDRFFVKQYQSPALSIATSLFVLLSIAGSIRDRSRAMLWNALTFGPFALFAWLMLDRFSISRFSIGYQPMFAIFAADGIARASRLFRRDTQGEAAPLPQLAITGVLVAAFVAYTLPALTPVRNELAPSIMAARAVVDHVDPRTERLFVGHSMSVFVDLVAPGFPFTSLLEDRAMPLSSTGRPAWMLAEVTKSGEEGFVFRRDRNALWNIARRHYFEIKLEPLRRVPRFVSGWYGAESSGTQEWRWMSGTSKTILPPGRGPMMLQMMFGVPAESMRQNPLITVSLNGRVIDRYHTSRGSLDRTYHVSAAEDARPNVLEITIDRTARTPSDTRELGLRMRHLVWGPE